MESFGKPDKEEPETASITDFNPVDHLPLRADKPIYTNIDYEVRYSGDGRIETSSPVIWRDAQAYEKGIRRVYVSPDAACIVIFQQEQLFILTKAGALLDTIREVSYTVSEK
jgi:hypothetical protein